MMEFKCPHCGSDKLEIVIGEGEEETIVCTECGCDDFGISKESAES